MQGLWNLIGKVGQGSTQAFPYDIGEKVSGLDGKSIWTLHKGKKKGTSEEVSIFTFDVKNSPPDQHEVAKMEYKRLKTLRHPIVLRFVDGLESESLIYMVTEFVKPLEEHLQETRNDLEISWGIHQIASGLDFLVNNGNLVHGNICMSSIFVDQAGEWKLGGVAYIQPTTPTKGAEPQSLSRFPWMHKYEPPEGRKGGKSRQKSEKWSPDMWGLGCLIWEVFNGQLQKSSSLKSVGKIPGNLLSHYGELVSANPRSRPNPAKFISQCRSEGQYLCNNFVDANLFLAELQVKSQGEQKEFFKSLSPSLDSFPSQFCKDKILPQLLNAFEYGTAGSTVLGPLFKIGKLLEAQEYEQKIVPCVVKLFSSTDRATRIQLLQKLDNFVQYLQPAVINDQIFPNIAMGFGDTVPAMREHTIKSMLLLTPKLSEKTINNHLLKYFAKLQMDEQPSIRTNTTVCLGKIAGYLPEATRQKVIVSAFLRALRDPFPPARMAGINALCATLNHTSVKECATRVLPTLCGMTVDPEKAVRDQSFKAIRLMLTKVEKFSEEPVDKENPSSPNQASSAESTSSNTSATWTGWAVSSLTSKFYKGDTAVATKESASPSLEKKNQEGPSISTSDVGEKATVKTTSIETKLDDDANSDSDYEDNEWDDDGWGEEKEVVTGLKKDLVAARNELMSLKLKADNVCTDPVPADGDDDSDSDFGDWDQDNWTSNTNDIALPTRETTKTSRVSPGLKSSGENQSSRKLKLGATKKTPINEDTLLSDLLGDPTPNKPNTTSENSGEGGWNGVKDSFIQDDKWTENFLQNETTTAGQKDGKKKTSDKKSQDGPSRKAKQTTKSHRKEDTPFNNTGGDGWGSEDWAPLEDATPRTSSSSALKSPSASEVGNSGDMVDNWDTEDWNDMDSLKDKRGTTMSKAEIAKKKREGRRREREQVLREKRAGKGP